MSTIVGVFWNEGKIDLIALSEKRTLIRFDMLTQTEISQK